MSVPATATHEAPTTAGRPATQAPAPRWWFAAALVGSLASSSPRSRRSPGPTTSHSSGTLAATLVATVPIMLGPVWVVCGRSGRASSTSASRA